MKPFVVYLQISVSGRIYLVSSMGIVAWEIKKFLMRK